MCWGEREVSVTLRYIGHIVQSGVPFSVWTLCNGTPNASGPCWICMCLTPRSVACVLWAYSVKHWARSMHLDSCRLACRVSHITRQLFQYWMWSVSATWRLERGAGRWPVVERDSQGISNRAWLELACEQSGGIVGRELKSCGYIRPGLSTLLCDQSPASAPYIWR